MGTIECDSFDEEDIDGLEAELENIEGPSLQQLANTLEGSSSCPIPITNIWHSPQLHQLSTVYSKDVRFIGPDSDSCYRAFLLTLLLLGT